MNPERYLHPKAAKYLFDFKCAVCKNVGLLFNGITDFKIGYTEYTAVCMNCKRQPNRFGIDFSFCHTNKNIKLLFEVYDSKYWYILNDVNYGYIEFCKKPRQFSRHETKYIKKCNKINYIKDVCDKLDFYITFI